MHSGKRWRKSLPFNWLEAFVRLIYGCCRLWFSIYSAARGPKKMHTKFVAAYVHVHYSLSRCPDIFCRLLFIVCISRPTYFYVHFFVLSLCLCRRPCVINADNWHYQSILFSHFVRNLIKFAWRFVFSCGLHYRILKCFF